MITFKVAGSTSASLGRWTEEEELPRELTFSDTRGISNDDVFFIQGHFITNPNGLQEIMIIYSPKIVERKLTIRKLNRQLEGKTTRSDTSLDGLFAFFGGSISKRFSTTPTGQW